MSDTKFITLLKGCQLPQYEFVDFVFVDFSSSITVNLKRRDDMYYTCANCGQQTFFHYDTLKARRVEDMRVGPYRFFWKFEPRRIHCPHCGQVHVEAIAGLTPHSRQTDRFRLFLARECETQSVSAVARKYGLNDDTVRKIDKEFLARRELVTPKKTCERLAIDEIAIKKGHIYATLFYSHDDKCVIGMVEGRGRDVVCDFFRGMGTDWCAGVKVVTADLWRAFKTAVRRHLPNATIVTDKFHVFKYAGDAMDEVRRSEYARQQDKTEFDLKKARFLLQRRNADLDARGQERIEQLKAMNENVYTAYLLKEQTITFYEQASPAAAKSFLEKWASACVASKLTPFVNLGLRLLRNATTILAYFAHRISNGFAEGMNNKVKVVKRMAYGFHDFEYFRLKILAASGFLRPLRMEWR